MSRSNRCARHGPGASSCEGKMLTPQQPTVGHKRWLAHVCVHPDCDHIEIHNSCNHAPYLCYASEAHVPGALPLRPVWLVLDAVQPTLEQAREIRSAAQEWDDPDYGWISQWQRPSQHYERGADGHEHMTEPLSDDEDWPGWPEVDIAEALRVQRTGIRS